MAYNKYNFYYRKKKTTNTNRPLTDDDFINDNQLLRFFMALHFNDFTFERNLVNQYNLTKGQIQKYSERLNREGLLIFDTFSELEENDQEAILKMTPDFDKFYARNPKCYAITPEGKEKGKQLLRKALEISQTNPAIKHLITQVSKTTKTYRTNKKRITKQEQSLLDRTLTTPSGVTYQRESLAKQNAKKLVYETLQELKLSSKKQELLSSGKTEVTIKQELSIIPYEEKKQEELREKTYYNGIYAGDSNAMIQAQEEVKNKDIRELKKETCKELKELHEKRDFTYEAMRYKGLTMNWYDKQKVHEEAMNFLDNL
jgi:hypothetical protein